MRIGKFAQATGLSINTLRYYDKIGLLTPEKNNQRRCYSKTDLKRAREIIKLKTINFSLSEMKRLFVLDQEMIISTKVGLATDGGRDCSKKYLKKACEQSLKKLQTDYLDIYQIHFDDPETPVEETLEALEELKITGKIKPRHRFEAGDIRRIDPLFQRGLFQSALKVVRRLEDLAAKYGNTPVQIGLNWVLNQPAVSFVLTGPSSVAHLSENLGSSAVKISAKDFTALNSFLLDEEKNRERIIEDDINEILASKLPNEKTEIIAELVYLLSGLVETGKTSEKKILPLFKQLMVWRKDSHDLTVIQGIKRELNQLYRLSKKEGKR